MKRNGSTVLNAIASEQLYDETSTPRAGTILKQAEFIPGLIQQLQDEPQKVIEEFEAIKQTGWLDITPAIPFAGKPTLFSSDKTGRNQVLRNRKCSGYPEP